MSQLYRSSTDGPVTLARTSNNNPHGANVEHHFNLLDELKHRTTDDYRKVFYKVPPRDHGHTTNPVKKHFRPKVSFDTINIGYDDDDTDWEPYDLEDHRWQVGDHPSFNRSHDDYLYPGDRGRSRLRLPDPREGSFSPLRTTEPDVFEFARMLSATRPAYPTTPIITFRGTTMARTHAKWDDLYKMKLYNSANGWLRPTLPNRVILVYISGRMHTWVALDWIFRSFIENGDTVVVVAAIDLHQLLKQRHGRATTTTRGRGPAFAGRPQAMTLKMRLRQRNLPEYMATLAHDVMDYCMEVMNPDIIARVCLEFCVGKTKQVLKEMYKLYEPNLVCTATKVNLGVTAPLRAWNSRKITDKLVSLFPLPVIIVSPMNMAHYEHHLEVQIDEKYGFEPDPLEAQKHLCINSSNQPGGKPSEWDPENDSDALLIDLELLIKSDDLYSSFDEILKLYVDYKRDVRRNIVALKKRPRDQEFFANFLRMILDKLADLCDEIRAVNPDFKGKGATLAHAITGLTSFSQSPYKTKLMLPPVEKKTALPVPMGPAVSYADTLKALKQNQLRLLSPAVPPSSNLTAPSVVVLKVSSPEDTPPPPKHRDIRFGDLETPSARKSPLPLATSELHKLKSHDVSKNDRPLLEPRRSHPDIHTMRQSHRHHHHNDDKEGGKKRGKFWSKIFNK